MYLPVLVGQTHRKQTSVAWVARLFGAVPYTTTFLTKLSKLNDADLSASRDSEMALPSVTCHASPPFHRAFSLKSKDGVNVRA